AEVLLSHVLQKPRSWLFAWPEKEISTELASRFQTLVDDHCAGKPLAYLTGEREFWSLPLKVTPDTLIPRPETELIVGLALECSDADSLSLLDLGTGSGAIALAIASEQPSWHITATDQSEAALQIAKTNAANHQVSNIQFIHGHWFEPVDPQIFDIIVSNPPYVAAGDPHLQQHGLPHEPESALVSGHDGLDDLRHIISLARQHLQPRGWLLVEHGEQQGPAVKELFIAAGFKQVSTKQDMEQRDRVTMGRHE
ncbi:MAG: peptide chain release factor N(5)-glutamine methyltransferase, partial [bacterium]